MDDGENPKPGETFQTYFGAMGEKHAVRSQSQLKPDGSWIQVDVG